MKPAFIFFVPPGTQFPTGVEDGELNTDLLLSLSKILYFVFVFCFAFLWRVNVYATLRLISAIFSFSLILSTLTPPRFPWAWLHSLFGGGFRELWSPTGILNATADAGFKFPMLVPSTGSFSLPLSWSPSRLSEPFRFWWFVLTWVSFWELSFAGCLFSSLWSFWS